MQLRFCALLVATILVVGAEAGCAPSRLFGAPQDEFSANEEVRAMVKAAEPKIRQLYPGGFRSIEPLSYKTQVVAGTNYLIRARVTDTEGKQAFVHLRIWRNLSGENKFESIRTKVEANTPITSFMSSDI